MTRKRLKVLIKIPEGEKLRKRAMNCHRLAVGADDPEFFVKIEAIAGEYEAKAAQADAKSPKK